jgi:hypothetical protein
VRLALKANRRGSGRWAFISGAILPAVVTIVTTRIGPVAIVAIGSATTGVIIALVGLAVPETGIPAALIRTTVFGV